MRYEYKKPISFKKKHMFVFFSILLGYIVIFLLFSSYKYTQQALLLKPVLELPRTEMKTMPKDVLKQIQTASISGTIRVPVLLYHYVEYVKDKRDTIRQLLDITPATFEAQVQTLVHAGYTFITASELADVFDGKRTLPAKPIMLTFDDGHWDLDTDVLPILEKYHVKATAFIISGFIGGSDFLSPAQLEDIIHSGLIEIGAHTVHHVSLKGKPLTLVQSEVVNSKISLEQAYHISVVSFAYPNGAFDQQAAQVIQASGFRTAYSTIPGIEQSQTNRFFLYRIRPGGRTGQFLLNWLDQTTFKEY